MGEGLLELYQTKLKKEYKLAFILTFFITLLIHFYKFANTLPNHDSIFNYYSDQNVLGSGRWALSLACGISSYWDLPWVIGVLSCVYVALTVVVIVALFKVKNPVLIGLIGAILSSAPAITETFFFSYTADGYMLAMLLAALAVYFSRIEETRKSRLILSGVCVCVACGIYQAYVSFALVLAVCYFIDVLLQDSYSKKDCFKWIIRQAIIYIASLASFFVIWKVIMHFSGVEANEYQGISQVGNIDMKLLVDALAKSVRTTLFYFIQWNVFEKGVNLYIVLNIIFLVLMAIGVLIAFIKSKMWERKWAVCLLAISIFAVVPFACIWFFTSSSVIYRPMMLESLALIFVLGAIIYERWVKPSAKDIIAILLTIIVFNNALMANVSYFYMNLSYERTYAEGIEMMSRIYELKDEYEFDKFAVLGNIDYEIANESIDPEMGVVQAKAKTHMLARHVRTTLLFNENHISSFLNVTFGLDLEVLDSEERNALLKMEEVQDMSCWPEGDSIKVIGDILVIKVSNSEETPG